VLAVQGQRGEGESGAGPVQPGCERDVQQQRYVTEVLVSKKAAVLVAVVLAAAPTSWAEEPLTVSTKSGAQQRGERLGAPELRLSLREAVTVALQHNINLEVSRLSLAGSQQGFLAASGIFDPVVRLDFNESSSTTRATNQLIGADVNVAKRRQLNLGLTQLLPPGTTLSVAWNNARSETNSQFYFINPAYDSSLGFTVTQPLLRGFGSDVNRTSIEVARREHAISRLEFERLVINIVQSVENAYWDLVYARENLKVARTSLALAQDLLDQTRTRVRIGTSAPIDIVQSEATVAAREQGIIIAENLVEAAADNLKFLMGFENPDDWRSVIEPVDTLEVGVQPVDVEEAIRLALAERLEVKQRLLAEDINRLAVVAAHNATRPRLDLVASYGLTGATGTFRDPQTGRVISQGWGDALEQIVDRDYDRWAAGVQFSLPLGNTEAKATLAQRRFALAQARQQLAALRQSIVAEVRAAVRNLEAGAKSIAAAAKARELAERNLDAEQKKFANGMSTNYQVLKIQEDLAAARASELQALVLYKKNQVALKVATGTLLANSGVRLADDEGAGEPHTFLSDVNWLRWSRWSAGAAAAAAEPMPAPASGEER